MALLARSLLLAGALVLGTGPATTVATAAGDPTVATLTSPAAVTTAATAGSAGTSRYRFAASYGGRPVRWDPCTTIRWTVNLRGAPPGGLAAVQTAVGRMARATGTRWVYVGRSSTVPRTSALPRTAGRAPAPVLIGWTDGRSSDLLRGAPRRTLGVTRTVWFGGTHSNGTRVAATRGAVVALDRTDRLPLRGGQSWTSVTLHELGHVMGLGHAADRRQLMAAVLPRDAADLRAGDRAGLARLGRGAGCVRLPF